MLDSLLKPGRLRTALTFAGLAMAAACIAWLASNVPNAVDALKGFDTRLLPVLLALVAADYALRFYRWRWLRMQADEATANLPVNDHTVAAAQRIVGELNEARTRAPTFGQVYTILAQIELNFLKRPLGYDHIQAGHILSRTDGYAAYIAG